MPYIKKEDRKRFENAYLLGLEAQTSGELNYVITQILLGYMGKRGLIKYQFINEAIGAIECAKLEFYRRLAAPYENKKIEENGDVYDDEVPKKI